VTFVVAVRAVVSCVVVPDVVPPVVVTGGVVEAAARALWAAAYCFRALANSERNVSTGEGSELAAVVVPVPWDGPEDVAGDVPDVVSDGMVPDVPEVWLVPAAVDVAAAAASPSLSGRW